MSNKSKIFAILHGYDANNRGDRLIIECQIRWLKQKDPGAEIRVFSKHFRQNTSVFPDSYEAPYFPPLNASPLQGLVRPIADEIHARRPPSAGLPNRWHHFHECDAYFLCGGGYLFSSNAPLISRHLQLICRLTQIALKTGKPVAQFPQSIGPFNKGIDERAVRRLCEKLPLVVYRNDGSLEWLNRWGLTSKSIFVPDIVLNMPRLIPEYYPDSTARYGLGIAPVRFGFIESSREEYVDKLVTTASVFHKQTGEPVWLFTQVSLPNDDDGDVVEVLARRLVSMQIPFHRVPADTSPRDYIGALGRVRCLLGARMHACILALTASTPTLGLAYQPKFSGVFHLLGMEERCQSVNDWSVEWATTQTQLILSLKEDGISEVAARIRSQQNRIQDGLDRLWQTVVAAH